MPYKIIKLGTHYVQVRNKDTNAIKAKQTTIEKAKNKYNFFNGKIIDVIKKNIFDCYYKQKHATRQKSCSIQCYKKWTHDAFQEEKHCT